MQLVGIRGIAEGGSYDVLAVREPGPSGDCASLREVHKLEALDWDLWQEVTQALYDVLPAHGPGELEWKPLRGEIREFTFGGLPGMAFRVVWFKGETERQIICSSAHLKTKAQTTTPPGAISQAEKHRELYFGDLERGREHRIEWMGVL